MSQHVFAWVAGFGRTLMPYAPFRFERIEGRPRSIMVEHSGPAGIKQVVVAVSDDGRSVRVERARGTGETNEVVDVIEGAAFPHWDHGAAHDHWRIESTVLSVGWPLGFAVRSVADAPPAFELVGPDESLIWVQGPLPVDRLPPLDQMEGPGQTTVGIEQTAGGSLVELRYQHDGAPWRMFHCIVDRYASAACVVTAQTPAPWREAVRSAVEEVAASLTPCPAS